MGCAYGRTSDIKLIVRLFTPEWNVVLAGAMGGLGLFWEPAGRRTELTLYFLPRFMEGTWGLMRKYGYVKDVPHGEFVLFAIAMSIIAYCYQNEPHTIK